MFLCAERSNKRATMKTQAYKPRRQMAAYRKARFFKQIKFRFTRKFRHHILPLCRGTRVEKNKFSKEIFLNSFDKFIFSFENFIFFFCFSPYHFSPGAKAPLYCRQKKVKNALF